MNSRRVSTIFLLMLLYMAVPRMLMIFRSNLTKSPYFAISSRARIAVIVAYLSLAVVLALLKYQTRHAGW